MPIFNAEKYIKKTLESLDFFLSLNSTNEVVLVNDGSDDRTSDIVKKYIHESTYSEQIRLLDKRNGGVGSARNLGLIIASQPLVLFLDDDDLLDDFGIEKAMGLKLSSQVNLFSHKTINRLGENVEYYGKEKKNNPEIELSGLSLLKGLIGEQGTPPSIWTGALIYKRDFLLNNEISYNEAFHPGEDVNFIWKTLYHAEDVSVYEENIAYYILREGSVTKRYNVRRIDGTRAIMDFAEYIKSDGSISKNELDVLVDFLRVRAINTLISNLYFNITQLGLSIANYKRLIIETEEYYRNPIHYMKQIKKSVRYFRRYKLLIYLPMHLMFVFAPYATTVALKIIGFKAR